MTNNIQLVTYLEPPQNVGNDETTIVFKQNMNRINLDTESIQNKTEGLSNDDVNEPQDMTAPLNPLTPHDETTQAYRHGVVPFVTSLSQPSTSTQKSC